MDKNNKQEERQEEKQNKSALDRVNQGINLARNARDTYNLSKRVSKKLKGSKQISRGASFAGKLASKGGQAIIRAAAGTIEIWGPIALVVGFIILVIIIIIIIFSGVQPPPACKSLTADKATVNKDNPTTLMLNDCPENVTYAWSLPKIGGSFSAPTSNTTTYTPPDLNQDTIVKVTVEVCAQANTENCSQYSISLNISYAPPSYPGITYSLKGPKDCNDPCRVKKGEPVTFNIEITYDEDKAEAPIENVSVALTLSTAVFTINSISGKTTAEFNPSLPLVKYLWDLSENQRPQDKDSKTKTFNFKVNLTPHVNNTETSINLDISGANPQ